MFQMTWWLVTAIDAAAEILWSTGIGHTGTARAGAMHESTCLAVHVPPCPYVAAQSPSDPLINLELDPSSLQNPRGFYPPTSVPMAPALLPVLAVALLCLAGAFNEVCHAS
jgi:hypothetical protein